MFQLLASLLLTFTAVSALASAPVQFLNAEGSPQFVAELRTRFETEDTRLIRAEKVSTGWTIRVFSKKYHRFESAQLNEQNQLVIYQAPRVHTKALCPDDSVQFIGFAPNDDDYELGIVQDVVSAAQEQGLKTVLLAKKDATAQAYLNYLSCPKVIGDFYDGDANPEEIVTADGTLTAPQIVASGLNFNYHVTHIWLACQAYNDPMLSSMITTTRSQKYAAGQNDLLIGPSDETAACTMKAALTGAKMSDAFAACYQAHDKQEDHWGFGGDGADYLGK